MEFGARLAIQKSEFVSKSKVFVSICDSKTRNSSQKGLMGSKIAMKLSIHHKLSIRLKMPVKTQYSHQMSPNIFASLLENEYFRSPGAEGKCGLSVLADDSGEAGKDSGEFLDAGETGNP
jgi:hypothetical protein